MKEAILNDEDIHIRYCTLYFTQIMTLSNGILPYIPASVLVLAPIKHILNSSLPPNPDVQKNSSKTSVSIQLIFMTYSQEAQHSVQWTNGIYILTAVYS
jgi:hypothetical protein